MKPTPSRFPASPAIAPAALPSCRRLSTAGAGRQPRPGAGGRWAPSGPRQRSGDNRSGGTDRPPPHPAPGGSLRPAQAEAAAPPAGAAAAAVAAEGGDGGGGGGGGVGAGAVPGAPGCVLTSSRRESQQVMGDGDGRSAALWRLREAEKCF